MNPQRKKSAARLQRNGANESTSDSYSAAGATARPDTSRSIKDGPYCWQNKKVLTHITETFAESDRAASARSVYVALSEVASDKRSDTFKVRKALIAYKAGVSIKTVERILKDLEKLGLVKSERGFAEVGSGTIKAPNTYTLLSMRLGDATTMRHEGKPTSKSDKVEESEKNVVVARAREADPQLKELCEQIAAASATEDELVEKLQPHFPQNRVPHEFGRYLKYSKEKSRTATGQGFVAWMLRARPELKRLMLRTDGSNYERLLEASRALADPPKPLTTEDYLRGN